MYLSKLVLDPRSRHVQGHVAQPYQMHRAIMQAFPKDLDTSQERVLWRLETGERGSDLVLLVQSWQCPDWSWLDAEPGYLLPTTGCNPAVKPFGLSLRQGQVLAFRLLANPTIKRRYEDKAAIKENGGQKYNGTRVGITDENEQRAWLERKGEQGGFRVLDVRMNHPVMVKTTGRRHSADSAQRLQFLAVRFDGILQVTDPTLLVETVRRGVGSAKGLGFGLLSLAPAP
jgi:CRISPR system Cascade subunit CasE